MSKEIETFDVTTEKVNDSPVNETVRRISQSVDAVDIIQKINGRLNELYKKVGEAYVNDRDGQAACSEWYDIAKDYQTALRVIQEVTSCKE